MTNDADVAVGMASLADFESLKDRLADYGFTRTRLPHRMRHRSGGLVDLLPFSESIAPGRGSWGANRSPPNRQKARNPGFCPT